MKMVVPVAEVYLKSYKSNFQSIRLRVYSEDTRMYAIIRDLVNERFSITKPTDDKEKELWVELKRLFEPDSDDTLWKLQSMRMEQYLTFTDHALWKVIVNGDFVSSIASASASAEGPIPPKTAEQKLARKYELKAKSTLIYLPECSTY
ncbi:hypothetical protein Tco_1466963 [Tanacetum coccineum]